MPSEQCLAATTWITTIIRNLVEQSAENGLGNESGEKAWDSPLIGFSRGDDPLYQEFKDHIGPFHWTPLEAFSLAFPDLAVKATELSVISWILPQTANAKNDNGRETVYPAERWARSRVYGEKFNVGLRSRVVAALQQEEYAAIAPALLTQWTIASSDRYGYASTWSERHAAYASGLGTFGLSDGLITPLGKAIRTGSVVARLQLTPTIRPYSTHQEYCLHFTKGNCGACIRRCPADAITVSGHDKEACRRHLKTTAAYVKSSFVFDGYGCGLCQTAVPCASSIPGRG